MERSRKQEVGVGILVVVTVALLAFMSLKVGALRGLGDSVQVRVVLADAAGLTEGAAVKVAGVDVGRVAALRVDHDRAVLNVELDAAAGLRADAIVQVRARSVLGEKYLALTPQSRDAPLLTDGSELAVARGGTEIDELVNRLGPLLGAVEPEALQSAIGALVAAINEDPARPARMLRDAETILAHGAEASAALPALVSDARRTLDAVDRTLAEARPILQKADSAVARLDTTAAALPAAVDDGRALMGDARLAIADSRRLLAAMDSRTAEIQRILDNLAQIDKWELRRLLREEGIVVRLRESTVTPPPGG
jgi:phospholipid/cholesterol/gamma-HCH transport system substrate-binding protein